MFQFSYNNALDDLNKALILKPNNIFLLAEKCRALMSMNQKIKCAHNLLLVKQHKDFIEFQSFNSDFIKGLEEFCNSKSK
jgi:hypothetical protein